VVNIRNIRRTSTLEIDGTQLQLLQLRPAGSLFLFFCKEYSGDCFHHFACLDGGNKFGAIDEFEAQRVTLPCPELVQISCYKNMNGWSE
jgi:hypothetical protein